MLDLLNPSCLRAAREAAGLSRSQLAARSKIHETTIGRIENGTVDPRVASTWGPLVRVLRSVGSHDGVDSPTKVEAAPGNTGEISTTQEQSA